ncbi:MAG: hypothetical protein QG599_428 [Pseudomonadota bacterium]|nr:hypothetical protein [Pseudomonadota bacterium]
MKAQPLFNRRILIAETVFVELVAWKVQRPVPGSLHNYKYGLALVADGVCVLRYDNEAGKGDHRHWGGQETPYVFTDIDQLVVDFFNDVTRWRDEHGDV